MDGSKVSTTKKYEVSVRFQNDVEKTEPEVHFEKNEKSRPRHKVSRNGLLPKLRTPEEVHNYSKDYLFFLSFMNSNLFDFFFKFIYQRRFENSGESKFFNEFESQSNKKRRF